MYYDIEKIKEELTPIAVVQYLGVRTRRSGKNIFILCPEHEERTGKPDIHCTNCVLGKTFKNAYYCYGCGAKGDCFNLIALLQGLDLKTQFREVLETASEACGGSEQFLVADTGRGKNRKVKEERETKGILTQEQLSLIGVKNAVYRTSFYEAFGSDSAKDINPEDFYKDTDMEEKDENGLCIVSYLSGDESSYTLSAFAKEHPESYDAMVRKKTERALEKYKENVKEIKGRDIFDERIREAYKEKYLETALIYRLITGKEADDGWLYSYEYDDEKKEPGTIF